MFTNHTHLLADNPLQRNYGVAVVDIDGDERPEIFVAGFGSRNLILKWDGSRYRGLRNEVLEDAASFSIGTAAGDLDADGREELYVLNTDTFAGRKAQGDRLFDSVGDRWIDLFTYRNNAGARNLTAGRSVACLDRSGDGWYGFFIASYGGPMRLYELNPDGELHDVAPEAGLDLVTGGRSVIALPLLSKRVDIFAANENGPNYLFRNRGDGTFEEVGRQAGISDMDQNGRGATAFDANGDGRLDLLYGNWDGPHRLFVQQEPGRFVDVAPRVLAAPSLVRTVIAADFDNDGYEELFFNHIGQPNRLFGWRGGTWQALEMGDALEPAGLGTGAAAGDFDGDGRLELLIAHGESGRQPLSLYKGPAVAYHWLRVRPLTRYGAPARGAVVTLEAGGRRRIRPVDAGSGYLCQMEPVAHFGLGTTDAVSEMTVRWPDGRTLTLPHPAIDTEHVVAYP